MPPRPGGLQKTFILFETRNNADAVLPASNQTTSYVDNDLYSHSSVSKALAALITLYFVVFVCIGLLLSGVMGYVTGTDWLGSWFLFSPFTVLVYPVRKVRFLCEAFRWMKAYWRQKRL